jgi:hypothetical protein
MLPFVAGRQTMRLWVRKVSLSASIMRCKNDLRHSLDVGFKFVLRLGTLRVISQWFLKRWLLLVLLITSIIVFTRCNLLAVSDFFFFLSLIKNDCLHISKLANSFWNFLRRQKDVYHLNAFCVWRTAVVRWYEGKWCQEAKNDVLYHVEEETYQQKPHSLFVLPAHEKIN